MTLGIFVSSQDFAQTSRWWKDGTWGCLDLLVQGTVSSHKIADTTTALCIVDDKKDCTVVYRNFLTISLSRQREEGGTVSTRKKEEKILWFVFWSGCCWQLLSRNVLFFFDLVCWKTCRLAPKFETGTNSRRSQSVNGLLFYFISILVVRSMHGPFYLQLTPPM